MPATSLGWLLCLTVLLGACGQKDISRRYEFVVRVTSDPGQALAGVGVVHRGKQVGVSGADGSVKLSARGNEGETLSFELRCPEGYRGPLAPLAIPLKTSADSSRRPEYAASCAPTTRTLVIAVRAEHGENLPVRYLGREVARTDRSGAAHLLLKIAPEDALELTLDTSEQPALRPKSPVLRLTASATDDLLVLNQTFEKPAPPPVVYRPRRRGPERIGGH